MLTFVLMLLAVVVACAVVRWAPPTPRTRAIRTAPAPSVPAQSLPNWSKLRETHAYWGARFTYLETGRLADLDKMTAEITENYPDYELMWASPTDPPPLPPARPDTREADQKLSATASLWMGGAGGCGSSNTTMAVHGNVTITAYGGDQRGSEALGKCVQCSETLPHIRGSAAVLCGDCHRTKVIDEISAIEKDVGVAAIRDMTVAEFAQARRRVDSREAVH